MKSYHVWLYHLLFWLARILHILAYNYYYFHVSWYKGAVWVQLVLLPFFYFNYAIIIPLFIRKKFVRFSILLFSWLVFFVFVYGLWTKYQLNWLYDAPIGKINYIETCNNIIHIWLASTCFCMLEHWVLTIRKNEKLALESKLLTLKTAENQMLNELLSEQLEKLQSVQDNSLPEKIILLTDFFKYILYSNSRQVAIKTELEFLKNYLLLKDAEETEIRCDASVSDARQVSSTSLINKVDEKWKTFTELKPRRIKIQVNYLNEILVEVE